jgi:hypothetical protein
VVEVNKKEFEIWQKYCDWYNLNGECGKIHKKCCYEDCPQVLEKEINYKTLNKV